MALDECYTNDTPPGCGPRWSDLLVAATTARRASNGAARLVFSRSASRRRRLPCPWVPRRAGESRAACRRCRPAASPHNRRPPPPRPPWLRTRRNRRRPLVCELLGEALWARIGTAARQCAPIAGVQSLVQGGVGWERMLELELICTVPRVLLPLPPPSLYWLLHPLLPLVLRTLTARRW